MARPAHGARGRDAHALGPGMQEPGMMPPSPLRDAFELIHFHLLFHEGDGITVASALSSIRDELDISPRRALGEALRAGLVERHADFLGDVFVRRGPRSDEVLRRVYGSGGPPTREDITAGARAWRELFAARAARLEAIRESARPTERNTAHSLPAWMP